MSRTHTVLRAVAHVHAPRSLRYLGVEHVLMSGAYGVAAILAHHPIGSAAVACGYGTVAVVSARAQRRADHGGDCVGRHALCARDAS